MKDYSNTFHGDSALFDAVAKESQRAFDKFGAQLNVPSLDPKLLNVGVAIYGIRDEETAKLVTDRAMKDGRLTWAHVAVEELAEVIGCKDEATRRVELIQLMSVCQRWIQKIDHDATRAKASNSAQL